MAYEAGTQRLYDRYHLVPRVGDRASGELCVMSLVALLAGERHGDRPRTACPVIAAYAIKINDAIDCDERQRLKPFAPRIVGTNDGRTRERAHLLARACVDEVMPRLMADAGASEAQIARTAALGELSRNADGLDTAAVALRAVARDIGISRTAVADFRYLLRALARDHTMLVASAAAVLLVDAARAAPEPRAAAWYWAFAVGLIDRMCDMAGTTSRPQRVLENMTVAEATRARHAATYGPLAARLRALFETA